MTTTVKFGLTEMAESQAGKYLTFNYAINDCLVLVNAAVIDRDLTDPPATPSEGDCYLIADDSGAPASGDWAGHEGTMAYLYNGAWRFLTLETGYSYWVIDEATLARVA